MTRAVLDELAGITAGSDPGRELEVDRAELAGRMQRLQGREEPTPELFLDFLGKVAVVDVHVEWPAEGFLQVLGQDPRLGLMTGEQPERLDVEDKVIGRALCPLLRRRGHGHRVVARVDLHHRKLRRAKIALGIKKPERSGMSRDLFATPSGAQDTPEFRPGYMASPRSHRILPGAHGRDPPLARSRSTPQAAP